MHKTLLLTGALICMLTAKSQTRLGVKAGVNLANQVKTISLPQNPSITDDTKPFVGYQLGGFYKLHLDDKFWLATEVNFSVIGSGMDLVMADGKTYHAHEKLGYLELPVMLEYKPSKLYLAAGPAIAFRLFSRLTQVENRSYKIRGYQALDASANFLMGYEISKVIDLNARYSHGFLNLYKDGGYASVKNRFFNLSLLYRLK